MEITISAVAADDRSEETSDQHNIVVLRCGQVALLQLEEPVEDEMLCQCTGLKYISV